MKRRNRSRLALLGILALALSVTAGLAASEVSAAKKKKKSKAGGTVDITKIVAAGIPDAVGPPIVQGVVVSTIDVGGNKFKGTQVRDVNATVQTTGAAAGSLVGLRALLTAPNGATVWLWSFLSGQNLGPLTFDDETFVQLVSSTTPPRDSTQVTSPYIGTVQPYCYFAFGGCPMSILDNGPASGTWTLRVFDAGPGGTNVLNQWRLVIQAGKAFKTK